jgi:hypothetical protein
MRPKFILLGALILCGCDDEPAFTPGTDFAVSPDEGVGDLAGADLVEVDLTPSGDGGGMVTVDMATAAADLAGVDLAGVDMAMAACTISSCTVAAVTATCGPSSCGFNCGACTGGGKGCMGGQCVSCAQACTDAVYGRTCPGQMGIRECTSGPQICSCGAQSTWTCPNPC